jgi:hypothetical protein
MLHSNLLLLPVKYRSVLGYEKVQTIAHANEMTLKNERGDRGFYSPDLQLLIVYSRLEKQ